MRALQTLVWAPFALVTSPRGWVLLVIITLVVNPPMFGIVLVAIFLIGGLCIPIERKLRPLPRNRQGALPKREKPKKITLAKLAVKLKGKAPTINRVRRKLSPELQKLLKQPVNRQPEAVMHDIKLMNGQKATIP